MSKNNVPEYFDTLLKKDNYLFTKMSVVLIQRNLIPEDIMERIAGYSTYQHTDGCDEIYDIDCLRDIVVNDSEDDTNETTKHRIILLLNKLNSLNVTHFLVEAD